MPRRPREEVPGGIHHVVAKGNAGARIVIDDRDRDALIVRVGRSVDRHRWGCLAYCVLDTHFHLIVLTPEPNLGIGMKWMLQLYSRDFNRRHDRQGYLFRPRFYSGRIATDSHLLAALTYVALNPVRAGIVTSPERWQWSSYAATVGSARPHRFLDVPAALELVDPLAAQAQSVLRTAVREAREAERATVGD